MVGEHVYLKTQCVHQLSWLRPVVVSLSSLCPNRFLPHVMRFAPKAVRRCIICAIKRNKNLSTCPVILCNFWSMWHSFDTINNGGGERTQNVRKCLQGVSSAFVMLFLYYSWMHCVTSRKTAGPIPSGIIRIFIGLILPAELWPWSPLSL